MHDAGAARQDRTHIDVHLKLRAAMPMSTPRPYERGVPMNISNNSAVDTAVAATQSSSAGSIQTAVLGAVLSTEGQNALALVQSIPQAPALATSGSVGTRLNAYA
jgi:hypothetical protein